MHNVVMQLRPSRQDLIHTTETREREREREVGGSQLTETEPALQNAAIYVGSRRRHIYLHQNIRVPPGHALWTPLWRNTYHNKNSALANVQYVTIARQMGDAVAGYRSST